MTVLPYIHINGFPLFGDYAIQPFGVLVLTGILLAYFWCLQYAKVLKIEEEEIRKGMQQLLIISFIVCHVFDVVFYQTDRLLDEGPLLLLKIGDGWSSMGGLVGASVALFFYFRSLNKPFLRHAEILMSGFVIGFTLGRLGCTVSFDHPGHFSQFFLAFQHPAGARHNLGFYEFLVFLFLFIPTIFVLRKKKLYGLNVTAIFAPYAVIRFFMDFLRSPEVLGGDERILGLTPAQWSCFLLLYVSYWWYKKIYLVQKPIMFEESYPSRRKKT